MKQLAVIAAILMLAGSVAFAQQPAAETKKEPGFETMKDRVSYSIGVLVGRDMKNQGIDLNPDVFGKGFKDTLSGAAPAMTDEEMQKTMSEFRVQMAAKKQAEMKKIAEENKAKEEAFLAENKTKEGVKTTATGLQYKVLKEGTGKMPTAYDTVVVHYRGTLLDGTEFDSSYKRNEPAVLPVSGLIPGWTEALQMMKAGSKWQLWVPSKSAYGEAGAGGVIPPNAALSFEVELISIEQPEGKTPPKKATGKSSKKGSTTKPAK
jgi:FKBP-type peptidyl-prolyl cis-trans isomerase FklB